MTYVKRLTALSAGLVLAVSASSALAAPPPGTVVVDHDSSYAYAYTGPEVPNWSGPYIGAHIGGEHSYFDNSANPGPDGGDGNVTAGGQIGMNWQSNRLVYGLEGDWSWLDLDSNRGTAHFNEGWQSTVRGRLGYAMGPWLPYATGGLAMTQVRSELPGGGTDDLRLGYAVGGGVEKYISPRVSGRLEYLHTDVPTTTSTVAGTSFTGGSSNDALRVGLNYHF